MGEFVDELMAGIIKKEIRPSGELWQIVRDNLKDHFTVCLCVAVVRISSAKIITWAEAEWIRDQIKKDEFWAHEMEEGALCYWTPGDIEKRYEYLDLKLYKK